MSPVKRGTKPSHYRTSPCFTPIKIEEEEEAIIGTLSSGESQPGPSRSSTNFSRSPSPILGKSPSPSHIRSLSPSTNSATYTAPADAVDVTEPESPGGRLFIKHFGH